MKKLRTPDEYETAILNYLRKNPSGLMITDIAEGIQISRNTASKYIYALESKGEIISKSIGVYKLYFSKEQDFIPKNIVVRNYIGLLGGFKSRNPENAEQFIKDIGKKSINLLGFPIASEIPKDLINSTIDSHRKLFDYYAKRYIHIDYIINKDVDIETEFSENEEEIRFIFRNVEYLDDLEDFKLHFYLVSGEIEAFFEDLLHEEIQVNVENISSKTVVILVKIIKS
jgi:DNA-binding Lrp family transcriptional regulator